MSKACVLRCGKEGTLDVDGQLFCPECSAQAILVNQNDVRTLKERLGMLTLENDQLVQEYRLSDQLRKEWRESAEEWRSKCFELKAKLNESG